MGFETETAIDAAVNEVTSRHRVASHAAGFLLSAAGFIFTLAITFLGLIAITFFIGRVVPIDPVLAAVGDRATKAVYEAAKTAMGLDQPLPVQFAHYVWAVLHGDFGLSVSTGQPVSDDLLRVFPATLEMATLGILIGVVLGVPFGVTAATRQGSLVDQIIRVVGLMGYSVPAFWLGLVDPRIFRVFCERYGLAPQSCVFIDDSEPNVVSARKYGMNAIHFTTPAALRAELIEYGLPLKA